VVVVWRLSSTNGAGIGSLRAAAAAIGAELGDTLVVVCGLNDASLDVVRVAAGVGGFSGSARCSAAPYAALQRH
jgi:hypothetical protein